MTFDKCREDVRNRNLLVLERRRQGESYRGIAEHFNLSRSRIGFILQEFADAQRLKERSDQLLAAMRQANDLNRAWPVDDLIDTLRPLPLTRSYLKRHFARQRTAELRLQTLLEMAIPTVLEGDNAGFLSPPLLRVYGVGKKGFWSVVNRLTNLDFGERFNEEWQRRLPILRREWKITGNFPYS